MKYVSAAEHRLDIDPLVAVEQVRKVGLNHNKRCGCAKTLRHPAVLAEFGAGILLCRVHGHAMVIKNQPATAFFTAGRDRDGVNHINTVHFATHIH